MPLLSPVRAAGLLLLAANAAAADHAILSCAAAAADDAASAACVTIDSAADLDKEGGSRLVEQLMSRGHFSAAARLLEVAKEAAELDLSTTFFQSASSIRGRLQTLSDSLLGHAQASGIPPAYEWAQSPSSIFLNVKFAHKLDTPATLGCEVAEAPSFTNRSVRVFAECKEKRKAFLLSLALLREIEPAGSSFSMASVGRASITLRKAANGTWPRLLAGKVKPGNQHKWWSMQEKHDEEVKAWEKLQKEIEKNATAAAGEAANASAVSASPAAAAAAADDASGDEDAAEAAATPASTPEPTAAPKDDALSRYLRALDKQHAAEKAAITAAEVDEIKKAEEANKKHKRGIDEAAVGQKADADKRYEEARAAAIEKRTHALAALTERFDALRASATIDSVAESASPTPAAAAAPAPADVGGDATSSAPAAVADSSAPPAASGSAEFSGDPASRPNEL